VRGYSVLFIFVYFVQIDEWETAKHLYAVPIFTDGVPADFNFASQPDFDAYFIIIYLVLAYL